MRTILKQIDDSFELKKPHELFKLQKLRIGDEVDIRVQDNSIIVMPAIPEVWKD